MHADANSGKLRNTLIIFEWLWALNSNFSEWMNLDDFLHVNTYSRKLKVTLKVTEWAWSKLKYGCVLLGHGTP